MLPSALGRAALCWALLPVPWGGWNYLSTTPGGLGIGLGLVSGPWLAGRKELVGLVPVLVPEPWGRGMWAAGFAPVQGGWWFWAQGFIWGWGWS